MKKFDIIKNLIAGIALVVVLPGLPYLAYRIGGIAGKPDNAPHYKKGECYTYKPNEFDKQTVVQINKLGKTDYAYSYYHPEYREYYLNLNSLNHSSFSWFEKLFVNKIDCPNGSYNVVKY